MSLKLGSSAQITGLCGIQNGGQVWVRVKRMFPAGGLDPENLKIRYFKNHENSNEPYIPTAKVTDWILTVSLFCVLNSEIHHKVFIYV